MPNGIKKWFMLQMWRIQQVAQIITIILLSFNLAVLIQPWMEWRGWIFEDKYTAVVFIMLVTFAIVWLFALVWDLRMRMWREQATVLIDRNPFAKEKLTSKEIAVYEILWFPVLERLAKDDPKVRESLEAMKRWVKLAAREESVAADTRDLMGHIGMRPPEYVQKDKNE